MSKISWICVVFAILCMLAIVAVNVYALNFTNGNYNAFDILFM